MIKFCRLGTDYYQSRILQASNINTWPYNTTFFGVSFSNGFKYHRIFFDMIGVALEKAF